MGVYDISVLCFTIFVSMYNIFNLLVLSLRSKLCWSQVLGAINPSGQLIKTITKMTASFW